MKTEAQKISQKKYKKSEKGKKSDKIYSQSEKGKFTIKTYLKNYFKTDKGRTVLRRSMKKYRDKTRLNLINLLGGPVCVRCGFNDIRALQIDHKNGGGVRETRKIGNFPMTLKYLKNPKSAKEKLQILCANCNWIKRCVNNELPQLKDPI